MSIAERNKALKYWDQYRKNLKRATVVNLVETEDEKIKRINELEKDHEAWFKYYFPNYYNSDPAPFHRSSTKRVMDNPEYYEVRAWSRELAKSARTMMEFIKLALTGKKRVLIITSASEKAAERLLKPYKINFETNQRIINDYGKQETHGSWTDGQFTIKKGATFVALGAGQSPRGLREEEIRPDAISVDDFDTDEICRNPDRVKQNWDWLEQALFAARSISNPLLVIFCGNIIAEDCTIKRAIERVKQMTELGTYKIINIRDKDGKPTWKRNTDKLIRIAMRMFSWASIQKEFYNNPIVEGRVFKEIHYGKMRPWREYKFLVSYTDPSYKKKGDYKATALIGRWKNEYHVIRMYCAKTTTAKMLDWNYAIQKEIGGKIPVYFYIEWPWIDDSLKLEIIAANERNGISIHPKPDERKKPEKYHRIESSLEPLNRMGKLIFNQALKDTEDMKAAEGQFLALSPTSRAHDDAPDAVEGAKWVLDSKTSANAGLITTRPYQRRNSNKHY